MTSINADRNWPIQWFAKRARATQENGVQQIERSPFVFECEFRTNFEQDFFGLEYLIGGR